MPGVCIKPAELLVRKRAEVAENLPLESDFRRLPKFLIIHLGFSELFMSAEELKLV